MGGARALELAAMHTAPSYSRHALEAGTTWQTVATALTIVPAGDAQQAAKRAPKPHTHTQPATLAPQLADTAGP
jgi:hypothetical protein